MSMGLIRFLYHQKSFILLCFIIYFLLWFNITPSKQSINVTKHPVHKSRSNSTFAFILNHLLELKLNLLLIDPYVLDQLFLRQLSFDKLDKELITFGIIDPSMDNIMEYLQSKTTFTIEVSRNTLIDHIFIQYQLKTIHLAVLHPTHSYYLIEKNLLPLFNSIHVSYGDTLRVIEQTDTSVYESLFSYPRNVTHFLWLYQTSEFLHCNQTLANQMETMYHLYQNASQLNVTVKPMRNVVQGLDLLEKHYWLAGGTLLGWYRHCGLIPFTQDADFGLFAEDYDESIRNYFLGNPISYLWGALGLVNDSLEFRLYTGRFTLDLFWAYREGDHRWCGYQVNRVKYRRTLPLLPKLCSGDLFGYRFSIPCSPVEYLDDEYGKDKWQSPLEKNYTWVNMKYHSVWNDISWMYATRLYTRDGKLRTDKFAIDWISKHFNYSLTSIPSFLNVIPEGEVTLPPLKSELVYGSPVKRKRAKRKAN